MLIRDEKGEDYTVTIPRLELLAALMALRLDKILRKEIDIHEDESVFWTGSTCVII